MGWQYVKSEVKKQPCHILLGAPTGIAACNVSGQTLHSMWNLPIEHAHISDYSPLSEQMKNRIKGNYTYACAHIIDEVSMVSNQMLLYLDMRMKEVRGSKDLFGGLPVMVLGDLFQLEPVNSSPPYVRLSATQINKCFSGVPCPPDLWKAFKYEELSTNHRQKGNDNAYWREVLSRVRFGMLGQDDIKYLKKRLIDVSMCTNKEQFIDIFVSKYLEKSEEGENPVCLLPKRSMCEEYNNAIMSRKGEKPIIILAKDRTWFNKNKRIAAEKKFEHMDQDDRQTAGLEKCLKIAINSRVMLKINDKSTPGLVNGARGTVKQFVMEKDGKTVSGISVKFDGIEEVQVIKRKERKIKVMAGCYVYRSMFPLVCSYAMTIHKSQSLSLSCIFADLGNEIFCSGMSYVALSRCQSYHGLYLMNFNPKRVKASGKACMEYARMFGKQDLRFNKGLMAENEERIWYTSSNHKKAASTTADDIQKEKAKVYKPGNRKRTTSKATFVHTLTSKKETTQLSKKNNTNTKFRSNVQQNAHVSRTKNKKKQKNIDSNKLKYGPSTNNPSFVPITDNVEDSVNLIVQKASLCPGTEKLLDRIDPEQMAIIYNNVLVPFGQYQSDQFKSRLAIELHPDPNGRGNFQQKRVSSDLMNIYGMYLHDLAIELSGPSVYIAGPYARHLYMKNSRNYIAKYIKQTHSERQHSKYMRNDYIHSFENALEVRGDPYDKDVIMMFSNEFNTHWYLTILDKRPEKMCIFHFDSGSTSPESLKIRCSFLIKFLNDFRAHVRKEYSLNWPIVRNLRDYNFEFKDGNSMKQNNSFDCAVYAMVNAESFITNCNHRIYAEEVMPLARMIAIQSLLKIASTSNTLFSL